MTSIITTLIIVLCRIPLINLLGDKAMGYYSMALAIYMLFMTCISYGIPKALSTLITEQSSKGQYALMYKTIKCAFGFAIIAGGITAAGLFFEAELIATHFAYAINSTLAIQGIAPCLLFISILGVLHGVYAGSRMSSISKAAHYLEEFLVAVLCILGAFIAKNNTSLIDEPVYSSLGASLGITCGVFIACIFSLVFYINHRKKLYRMAVKDKTPVKETGRELILLFIKTMIPFVLTLLIFHLSRLVDYTVFNRMMSVQGHKENSYIILLGMLNGKYEFFISLPLVFVNWYAASKVPMLKKLIQEENVRKIHNKISQSIRYTMLYIIPFTAFFVLYAKPLMNLCFSGINDTPALLLRLGAVSIVFYSLTAISNATLNALDEWAAVVKNALISLIIQTICLLIMMVIFQWTIIAVVFSRIIFSLALFVLNEHTLRERTSYVQEQKRAFILPAMAAAIMCGVSFVVFLIFNLFLGDKEAVVLALLTAVPAYILALVFTGGITPGEMYRLPGGKFLAPFCKKLHLIK